MIWAILALLGVPLWVCAAAITIIIFRNRELHVGGRDVIRDLTDSLWPAGESPVRVLSGGPVAGWRLVLETGRVEAQRQEPLGGSN